jgi:hypothetical protein
MPIRPLRALCACAQIALLALLAPLAHAEPYIPTSGSEVIEHLPFVERAFDLKLLSA